MSYDDGYTSCQDFLIKDILEQPCGKMNYYRFRQGEGFGVYYTKPEQSSDYWEWVCEKLFYIFKIVRKGEKNG